MYNEQLEMLIDAALADGVLTEKEKQVLFKKAQSMGVDLDEFEIVLEGRLAKIKKQEDMTPSAAPAKEKLGNIVTCPACGAHVPGGVAVCPDCGHEFRNVQVNSSLKKLTQQLEEANAAESDSAASALAGNLMGTFNIRNKFSKVENVLMNFPVPNTSEDLLEVLTFVKGYAVKHSMDAGAASRLEYRTEHAYWLLYEKCVNKARLSFAKDKRFTPFYEHYDTMKNTRTPEQKVQRGILLICGGGFLLLIVLILLFSVL